MMESRILVIDDEKRVREMLTSILSDEGWHCLKAQNAKEAIPLIESRSIDLALIDIMMPGISGVQTLLACKKINPDMGTIMVTGNDDIDTAMFCIRSGADDYIVKPFKASAIVAGVQRVLQEKRKEQNHRLHLRGLEKDLRLMTERLERTAKVSNENLLSSLIKTLDAREKETGSHSGRVRQNAQTLATAMGIKGEKLEDITLGAMLHDIGKIGVPDSILLKPGKLDEEEWDCMKKHPQIGYDIISEIEFLEGCAEIVLAHHERYDGKGYPNGLKGEQIPLGARIFSVVDTLDAMTSDRPYRKALTFEVACAEIIRCRGTQFDPRVVEAFLTIPQSAWDNRIIETPSAEDETEDEAETFSKSPMSRAKLLEFPNRAPLKRS